MSTWPSYVCFYSFCDYSFWEQEEDEWINRQTDSLLLTSSFSFWSFDGMNEFFNPGMTVFVAVLMWLAHLKVSKSHEKKVRIKVNKPKHHPMIMICVEQNIQIVLLIIGNGFSHQVGSHQLIKEQRFAVMLISLICEESHLCHWMIPPHWAQVKNHQKKSWQHEQT